MKSLAGSPSRPRLSVAMIVRDEQDVLALSIDSVRSIADEIVVLDSGSTDRTADLAAELGATVYHAAWNHDFAAARNTCLRRVAGNWVFWLDAGEQLAGETAAELRSFIDRESTTTSAYSVLVESPPRDEGASAELVRQFRLLPNRVDLRFIGRVRETVEDSVRILGLKQGDAPGRILRHPRQHEAERYLAKAQRDLALATAEAEATRNWPPRLLLAAGQAHNVLGQQDQARELLRRAIETAPAGAPQRLEAYYALLTTFDDDPEMHASQLTACLDSLEDFPFDLQLLLALGNYMLVRERLDLAIRAFDAAVRFGRITPSVWHLCEAREIAAVCLSMALQARQRDDEARTALETALAIRPDSLRLVNQLHSLYSKQGKLAEAAALADRLSIAARERVAGRGEPGAGRQRLRIDRGEASPILAFHVTPSQSEPVSS